MRQKLWRLTVISSLLTAAERKRLAQRAHSAIFQPAAERLRRDAAAFFAMQLQVPERPGGYYHDYVCPQHGVELIFDPHGSRIHRCPVDNVRWEGDRFDAAWRWFINHHLAEASLRLAVLWRIDGDGRHRDAVRRILLDYSERYESYGRSPRTGQNPGVATYTTLDESVWATPLAWAFSLIAESLPAAETDAIAANLLEPAAEHLVRRRYPDIHNFTCWHNAAIATLGVAAGRADLVRVAREGDRGQVAQLDRGILRDGLWYEGSMSYHFYSVWAIVLSILAFRHDPEGGIAAHPAISRALAAPIRCAYPDGSLPATNDCWYFTSTLGPCCHGVPPAPELYEIAYTLYGDPAFAATFTRRDSVFALLFGVEHVPPASLPARTSVCLPESGLAFLRPDSTVDLLLKYGPHGGAHGHPDKLSLTGWVRGWRFSSDLGTPGYGVASLESWYRQTLSHNTILIDGESQPPMQGALRSFETQERYHIAEAVAEWPGVALRRTVAACADYFIDAFEVICEQRRRIDWIYHNAGRLENLADFAPLASIAGGEAYCHLSETRERAAAGPLRATWVEDQHAMTVWMPAGEERIYTGLSPDNPPGRRRSFVLRVRYAERTVFLAVFHPHEGAPRVVGVEWGEPGVVRIQLPDRTDEWGSGSGSLLGFPNSEG